MYLFKCEDVDGSATDALLEIPGVKVTPKHDCTMVASPDNAAWLVHSILRNHAISIESVTPQHLVAKKKYDSFPECPGLREWVPAFLSTYQRTGVQYAAGRTGSHFWWPTGSGKSLGAITWACAGGEEHRTVFVTRAAARRTIFNEVNRFTTLKAQILMGKEGTPVDEGANFVVVGWETLPFHIEELAKWKPISVVYDESHKGKSAKRWEAIPQEDGQIKFNRLNNISSAAERLSRTAQRRLSTTATPIKDRLRDLWAQLDLVEPFQWGKFYDFTKRYCDARENPWGGLDTSGRSNVEELKKRFSFAVHQVSYSTTHGELPAKRRIVTYVSPEDQIKSVGFAREMKEADKRGGISALECRLAEASSRKRKAVIDLVTDAVASRQKVVVFTGRRKDCETLHEAIKKAVGEGVPVWMGHGGTPVGTRDMIRESYMAQGGPCVLVGTGDAWGESVNLQDTDLAIISMLPYTPGQVIQWEGRFARKGQKRPVLLQYLICEGTVDEHVAGLLLSKLPAVDKVAQDEQVQGFGNDLAGLDKPEELIASLISKIGAAGDDDGDD